MFCIPFALELIALAMGGLLLMKVVKHKDLDVCICKAISYIVIVLAFLALLCTSYCAVRSWFTGSIYTHRSAMMKKFNENNFLIKSNGMKKIQATKQTSAKAPAQ